MLHMAVDNCDKMFSKEGNKHSFCEKDSAQSMHESQLTELLLKRQDRKHDADCSELLNFNPTYPMCDLLQVILFTPLSLKVYFCA